MKNRMLLFAIGIFQLTLWATLSGQIIQDRDEISFLNLEKAIATRVETNMKQWMERGEFENSTMYRQRLNQQEAQLDQFTEEAIQYYLNAHLKKIDFSRFELSRYDADSETYRLKIHRIGPIILRVPLEDAPFFKANKHEIQFTHPNFFIQDNAWVLESIEVHCLDKTFRYQSSDPARFEPGSTVPVASRGYNVSLPRFDSYESRTDPSQANLDPDIDLLRLPQTRMFRPNAIAIVIGNRNYYQTKSVDFAHNDADLMKRYLVEVLGFRDGNVIVLKDISKGIFDTYFGTVTRPQGRLYNMIKPEISEVFIYYSGHGAPGLNDKEGYFVPIECEPNNVELGGYPLSLFYKNLAVLPAKSKTVVLDACFSGADILNNLSPIAIRTQSTAVKDKNTVAFTSSSGSEVSSWYNAKEQGLFTYFFLKAIQNPSRSDLNRDRRLSFRELHAFVADQQNGLPYYARRLHGLVQTPTLQGGNLDGILLDYGSNY